MQYLILSMFIIISYTSSFGQESQKIYQSLQGVWNGASQGEMDIIFTIDNQGAFALSIIPAFEYTNMSSAQQSNIIAEYSLETGYIKVLKTFTTVNSEMEILLNGELTTNILEINANSVFIINSNNNKELFMQKESF